MVEIKKISESLAMQLHLLPEDGNFFLQFQGEYIYI